MSTAAPSAVQVGEVTLTQVLDASGPLGGCNDLYPDVPIERWDPYRPTYPELFAGDVWRLPVTCTVVRGHGRTVLVDAGMGPAGQSGWDLEQEALLAGGLPAAIDTVFFTHLHIDHVGWLAEPSLYTNARIAVHADALAYASEHSPVGWLPGTLQRLRDEDRVDLVAPGDEVLPGVRVVSYPGHYPGHLGLDVAGEALLIGDAAPHPALLDQPNWHFRWDHDAALASTTRAALVDSVVDSGTLVVCGHYPGSGIGRVVSRDDRVEWEEGP
jgi:glyoxylase-like metal-dependent hydrolase (beta-lactamase superfamily II)